MDVADPYYGRDEDFDDCLARLREVTPLVVREVQLRLTDPAV
ncbi:unannotated protein [freshwater metagenome]|uniref:Unannotated protein n=1 Tax=freshwater metagenome TaxID=449393 RepID=A0A6J6W7M8_9ZZZZ